MTVGVVRFPGSNCERDVVQVLTQVTGCETSILRWDDASPPACSAYILPGGFAHGDYLRAGALAAVCPVMSAVKAAAARGVPVLGICNGFQILVEAGLLPGSLRPNQQLRFVCRWVNLRVERTGTPWTSLYEPGESIRMPIAHGEGRYEPAASSPVSTLDREGQVAFRYVDGNPNGSVDGIAGISSREGHVLGLMPHPERCSEAILGGTDGRRLFASLARWIDAQADQGGDVHGRGQSALA